MAAQSTTRPILSVCLVAGLVAGLAGCGGVSRPGFLAAPRLPADAPPIQSASSLSATAPNDAGIPALGSGGAYSAQMTPNTMPGVDAILARLDELDNRITGLQQQFQATEPAISRLTRIDGDIRALLMQMEGAVAARAEDAPVSKAVTSRPSDTPVTLAMPVRPAPLAAPDTAKSNMAKMEPAQPPLPLAEAGTLRLSLSPDAPPMRGPAAQTASAPTASPLAASASAAPVLTAAVHLASYRSVENAREGWRTLVRRYPGELDRLVPMIVQVDLGDRRGPFLRLQGSALTRDEARALCDRLKKAGQYCIPTVDTGAPLNHASAPSGTPSGTPVASIR